jgi:LmbE family N-acetylglucosaminyl deacetylase
MNQHHELDPANDRCGATAYTTVGNSMMKVRRALPKRLLGVWAHPDDEAYLSAGLMARVVDAGGSVTVVTATKGEKGTGDPRWYDTDAFGELRAGELATSLAELGVTDLRFLGLRDGECDIAKDEDAIDAITQVIEDVLPDTIVTFGPDGITNHPDHRAASAWATEAWRRAGHGELLYAAMTHDYVAKYRDLHDEIGAFADCAGGRPVSVGRASITLECALDEQELDRKRRALTAHGSQTAGLAELMGESTYRTWWRDEHFRAPTRSEIARCDLPDRRQPTDQRQHDLIGATA